MLVRDYCTKDVRTVSDEASLREVARRMREDSVGSLVVLDSAGRASGIVTDRDLALRVLAAGSAMDPDLPVRRVMSSPLEVLAPGATVEEAIQRMRTLGLRRLPVCEGDAPVGILARDDVLDVAVNCLHDLAAETTAKRRQAQWRARLESARDDLEHLADSVSDRLKYTSWYSRERLFDEIDALKRHASEILARLD